MISLFRDLPLTRIKLFISGCLYRLIRIFVKREHRTIKRRGIRYEIDLSEFIDLSLFVAGTFQKHITDCPYFILPPDAVVFDVGANVGAITLPFAGRVPKGHIYAFEPASFAYEKLLKNIALNPVIAQHITPVQALVSNRSRLTTNHQTVYAEWKVCGNTKNRHPMHGGGKKTLRGIKQITLDDFCNQRHINRIDLIKIDVEGYEYLVLQGSRKILTRLRPVVIFEAGLYLMKENKIAFNELFDYLTGLNYRLIGSKNGKHITAENYRTHIPRRSTIDIIALPKEMPQIK